jgi:hypothetical protein
LHYEGAACMFCFAAGTIVVQRACCFCCWHHSGAARSSFAARTIGVHCAAVYAATATEAVEASFCWSLLPLGCAVGLVVALTPRVVECVFDYRSGVRCVWFLPLARVVVQWAPAQRVMTWCLGGLPSCNT